MPKGKFSVFLLAFFVRTLSTVIFVIAVLERSLVVAFTAICHLRLSSHVATGSVNFINVPVSSLDFIESSAPIIAALFFIPKIPRCVVFSGEVF